jgi:hypothetical protein
MAKLMYLNEDSRSLDYWLDDTATTPNAREVDLSDEFIERYHEAVMDYDGIQAELELIYKSKEMDVV